MAYKFKELTTLKKVATYGNYSFKRLADTINYVSLGDSIAAGQRIREEESLQYPACLAWQYGDYEIKDENDNIIASGYNAETTIQDGSYTALIRNYLEGKYGKNHVNTISFARSGDVNTDLRNKLNDARVIEYIKKADIITVSIGANTVLGKAIPQLSSFITEGAPTLQALEFGEDGNGGFVYGDEGFNLLGGDEGLNGSYRNIFARLAAINKNPNTKFIFTTVYNPYKYLWLDPSTDGNDYEDGYFGPTCSIAPNIEADNPFTGNEIINVRKFVHEYKIGGMSFKLITERINDPFKNYPDYIEKYGRLSLAQWVEKQVNSINEALRNAIEWARGNGMGDERFILADTKSVYESVPDKLITADKHYNDLVNVEIVRGETVADLDWGELHKTWEGNSLIENAKNIVEDTVIKVVLPDIDPHPETYGQYALYRSFADALGWESLVKYTITYSTGEGGTVGDEYEPQTVASCLNNPIFAIVDPDGVNASNQGYRPKAWSAKTGYYWTGFNLSSGTITPFVVDGVTLYYYVMISSDSTLYAQWSNEYTVEFYKFTKVILDSDTETGNMELRSLTINNTVRTELNSAFNSYPTDSNRASVTVKYGDSIVIYTSCKPDGWDGGLWYIERDCRLDYPGGSKTGTSISWAFDWNLINPKKNRKIIIDFQWFFQPTTDIIQRWQSWWDCHVAIE